MADVFVITYDTPKVTGRIFRLWHSAQDTSSTTPLPGPGGDGWAPSYTPAQYELLLETIWNAATDSVAPVVQPPSDLSITPRYTPSRLNVLQQLLRNEPQDTSNITGQPPSDLSAPPRYRPGVLATLQQLLHNEPEDASTLAVQVPAELPFMPSYRPSRLIVVRGVIQSPNTDFAIGPPPTPARRPVGYKPEVDPWIQKRNNELLVLVVGIVTSGALD